MRIAFASGKGGTGKTTLATNLAALLADEKAPVTYVDCDVEEPNGHLFFKPDIDKEAVVQLPVPRVNHDKCTYCGECARVCEYNAIAVVKENVMVFDSLCHGCGACYELCPEKAITEAPRPIGRIEQGMSRGIEFLGGVLSIGESLAPPVTRELKKLIPSGGVVIIDAPPGTSCPVIEAVKDCDYVVLVTESTPFGLNDLKLAHLMVKELGLPCGVVINRAGMGDDRVNRFCRDEQIDMIGEIPFDRHIAEAYSDGRLSIDVNGGFAASVRQLFNTIKTKADSYGTSGSQR